MKITKGTYGYRNHHRRQQLFLTLFFVAAIILQLVAKELTGNSSAKNILTVMAVLTVLPMANIASPLIASWKYKTSTSLFYEKVAIHESRMCVLYDLVITSKEAIMPMDAMAVHPTGIIAFCSNKQVDESKAETFLNEMLLSNQLEFKAKVIKEEQVFLRRLSNLKPSSDYEENDSLLYVTAMLKNISM